MNSMSLAGDSDQVNRPEIETLWTIHHSDARETDAFLDQIAAQSDSPGEPFLTATITSPPYGNIVDYGVDGQIGFAQTYEQYLAECGAIFNALFRWTRDDGALWIVADSIVAPPTKLMPGRLLPLPFDLSHLATQAGWVLRDVIVWRKDRTRPWSNRGRLRNGFEYVLYFVKSNHYKYNIDRLRDSTGLKSWWVKYPERHNPWGMTPDNVWEIPIPVQGSWASPDLRHACPFPAELVRRMISLSTDEGDIVFDPFAGSGMVAAVSETEGRIPLGTELNIDFIEAFEESIRPNLLESGLPKQTVSSMEMTERLLALRVLKYPKDLLKQLLRSGAKREALQCVVVEAAPFDTKPRTTSYAEIVCDVIVADKTSDMELHSIQKLVTLAQSRPPLSKYTVEASVKVRRLGELVLDPNQDYAVYRRGRVWRYASISLGSSVEELIGVALADDLPPVVSLIAISQGLEGE